MKTVRLFTPLVLICAWPFISFANYNAGDVPDFGLVVKYGVIFLFLMFLVAVVCLLVFRHHPRSRILNTLVAAVCLFFTFAVIEQFLYEFTGLGRLRYPLVLWFVVFFSGTVVMWWASKSRHTTMVLTVAVAVMVLVPTGQLIGKMVFQEEARSVGGVDAESSRTLDKPNVLFFVFDGYSRADQLAADLNFDSTPFINYLRSEGFFVASEGSTNYPMTQLALSAILEMNYIAPVGKGVLDKFFAYKSVLRGFNNVVRRFKSHGYRYIHGQPGGWDDTKCGGSEFLCIKGDAPGSFNNTELALMGLTPMMPLAKKFIPQKLKFSKIQFPDVVDKLKAVKEAPFFLFSHLLQPHDVDRREDCTPVSYKFADLFQAFGLTEFGKSAYVEAIKCINKQILAGLPDILKKYPDAIIIFIGDHGFALANQFKKSFGKWTKADRTRRFGVLNAIRLPKRCRSMLYDAMTSVNTFRVVFACLEGRKPDLLPDQSFFASYFFNDVEPVLETP